MQETEQGNLDIAAARPGSSRPTRNARIAGAPLLPIIDLMHPADRSRAADLARLPGTSGGTVRNLFSTGLSASYEIDFWGKNRAPRGGGGDRHRHPLRPRHGRR